MYQSLHHMLQQGWMAWDKILSKLFLNLYTLNHNLTFKARAYISGPFFGANIQPFSDYRYQCYFGSDAAASLSAVTSLWSQLTSRLQHCLMTQVIACEELIICL